MWNIFESHNFVNMVDPVQLLQVNLELFLLLCYKLTHILVETFLASILSICLHVDRLPFKKGFTTPCTGIAQCYPVLRITIESVLKQGTF